MATAALDLDVLARRLLLGAGHNHGSHAGHNHAGHDHADHAEAGEAQNTLALRVVSIFVILAAALAFGLPTLFIRAFRSTNAPGPRLMRAFAGGIIVALALIHIIPECVLELEGLVPFHIAGVTVVCGILFLVLTDNVLAAWLAPPAYKDAIRASLAKQAAAAAAAASAAGPAPGSPCGSHSHSHGCAGSASPGKQLDQDAKAHAGGAAAEQLAQGELALQAAAGGAHGHQCLRSLNATGWAASGASAAPLANLRQYITAYTMELGCVFHSCVIGVGLGVITSDRQLVVTLMVALAIHQGLEALALGSVLALTSFSMAKKVFMLCLYACTTPIGIAVGISIAASYDPSSVTSRAVQGTLNGVSGGMLLYIGMYQLVAEEFSREDLLVRPRLRLGMYAALLAGAACMAVLGIWA